MQKLLGMALMLCAYPITAFSQNSNWIRLDLPPEAADATIAQVLSAQNGRLLLKSSTDFYRNSVFYSDDHGENWEQIRTLPSRTLNGMTALCDGRLLMGITDKILQSEDFGLTWSTLFEVKKTGVINPEVHFIRMEQARNGKILAEVSSAESGLSIGDESGMQWTYQREYGYIQTRWDNSALLNSEQILLAAGYKGGLLSFKADGSSWIGDTLLLIGQHGEGPWSPRAVDVNKRGDILVATDNVDARFFGSADGGATWSLSRSAGPEPSNRHLTIVRSDRHDNFFVSGANSLWYTDNLGVTWSRIGPDIDFTPDTLPAYVKLVELDSAGYVYVANPKELFRSQNPVYSVTDVEDDTPEAGAESFGTAAVRLTPNPATDEFAVDFNVETQGLVTAELFDVRGCLVKQVFQRIFPAGEHCVTNKMDVQTAGVYILRLSVDGKVCSTPLTILR